MSFELAEMLTEENSFLDQIIEEIASKLGKSISEVYSMINEKQERMMNIPSFEVVALIVAKEVGIDISKYIQELEKCDY